MLKFFVRRPITTLMFVLVWVVLGLVSFPNMRGVIPCGRLLKLYHLDP